MRKNKRKILYKYLSQFERLHCFISWVKFSINFRLWLVLECTLYPHTKFYRILYFWSHFEFFKRGGIWITWKYPQKCKICETKFVQCAWYIQEQRIRIWWKLVLNWQPEPFEKSIDILYTLDETRFLRNLIWNIPTIRFVASN